MPTNTISISITVTNTELNDPLLYSWPIYINGGSSGELTEVTFGDDIFLDDVDKYFIIDSEYVVIDGNKKTVTITSSTWSGLIFISSGISNTTVKNINLNGDSSTLLNNSGWICRSVYGRSSTNNLILNCSSSGTISPGSGGIVGQKSPSNNGELTISHCFSTGTITNSSGGIIGIEACSNGGSLMITNCFSTGSIENGSGGITGSGNAATRDVGTITITKCYSTGEIKQSSGGIGGEQFGRSKTGSLCTISNCYSTGNITGTNAGGIVGWRCAYGDNSSYPTNVLITNCYSLGSVDSTAGSIVGGDDLIYPNGSIANITVSNCYTLYEDIVSPNFSISGAQLSQINNYAESSTNTWNDANAVNYLTGTPTYVSGNLSNPLGSVWADISAISSSTPWIFTTFFYSPYTTELTEIFEETVSQDQTSSAPVISGSHTYTIVAIDNSLPTNYPEITIDNSTGIISVGKKTPVQTYVLKILQESNYTMTNFILNVLKGKFGGLNENEIKKYCIKIKKNEKLIINLNEYYESNLIDKYIFLKYPTNGSVKITKCNKLIYTPDENYFGKDKFTVFFDNVIPQFSQTVKFIIKIKN